MATLKGKAQQSSAIARQSEGNDVYLRALRDGALVQADWKQAAIMAGYGYQVNVGDFSTGAVGGGVAGTVLDADGPDFLLSIPNGVCVLPLRIGVHVQHGAVTTQQEAEILIAVDQDAAWDATGASTEETIYNINTLCGNYSSCKAESEFAVTTITTDPVLDIELARKVVEFDVSTSGATAVDLDLVYEPKNPPVINGPAMLLIFYGGDTATIGGFCDIQWLELPESVFKL